MDAESQGQHRVQGHGLPEFLTLRTVSLEMGEQTQAQEQGGGRLRVEPVFQPGPLGLGTLVSEQGDNVFFFF